MSNSQSYDQNHRMTIELTPQISEYICDQLAQGRSLISICNNDEGIPSHATVSRWINKYPDFAINIAHAREAQADYFLDKQIEFAETATVDDYQLRKFQADNLKWVAAKLRPKKYGDSTQIKHADADGNKLSFTDILSSLDGRTASIPGNQE